MFMSSILACVMFFGVAVMAQSFPAPNIPAQQPPLGSASHDGIVKFEDLKKLSPSMIAALKLLRAGKYKAAEMAFQQVQRSRPQEALAYKGETEAAQRLETLNTTVTRYRRMLSSAESNGRQRTNTEVRLAVLHWALGEAIMMQEGYYPKFFGGTTPSLSDQARAQFQEALQLDPDLLIAHLSLAAYYEHVSQQKGSLARLQYREALRLRPDLYQIRYLHAYTWDRPGILLNKAHLIKIGIPVTEDMDKMPQKAISEYLALIRDHPRYAPPYYCLGDDYDLLKDEAKAKFYWQKYLELGSPKGEAWKRVKSIVDYMNKHPS